MPTGSGEPDCKLCDGESGPGLPQKGQGQKEGPAQGHTGSEVTWCKEKVMHVYQYAQESLRSL